MVARDVRGVGADVASGRRAVGHGEPEALKRVGQGNNGVRRVSHPPDTRGCLGSAWKCVIAYRERAGGRPDLVWNSQRRALGYAGRERLAFDGGRSPGTWGAEVILWPDATDARG